MVPMRERHEPSMLVTAGASIEMTCRGKHRVFIKVELCNPKYQILSQGFLISFVPFVLCPSSPKSLVRNLLFSVTRNATRGSRAPKEIQ